MNGLQPVGLAKPTNGLMAALEESGVKVACDDTAKFACERTRHATDTATNLDKDLVFVHGTL